LDETGETRSPHRRYFGDLLWAAHFPSEKRGGITLAARATLDMAHMMDSSYDFNNYFGLQKSFL
jgi:hypothetical protein